MFVAPWRFTGSIAPVLPAAPGIATGEGRADGRPSHPHLPSPAPSCLPGRCPSLASGPCRWADLWAKNRSCTTGASSDRPYPCRCPCWCRCEDRTSAEPPACSCTPQPVIAPAPGCRPSTSDSVGLGSKRRTRVRLAPCLAITRGGNSGNSSSPLNGWLSWWPQRRFLRFDERAKLWRVPATLRGRGCPGLKPRFSTVGPLVD